METRSYALCAGENFNAQAILDKVHLNVWQLSLKELYIEFGAQIKISKNDLNSNDSLDFTLFTPFLISDNNVRDLYDEIKDSNNVQLIFNDDIAEIKPLNREKKTREMDIATLITFKNREKLLLVKPRLQMIRTDKLSVNINTKDIDKTYITDQSVDLYFRIRYKASVKSPSICLSQGGGFCDRIYYDIRYNEVRLLPQEDLSYIIENKFSIRNFYVFIMQEFDNKIVLTGKDLKYTRFLEKKNFSSYIKEISKIKSDFIVYYWKISQPETKEIQSQGATELYPGTSPNLKPLLNESTSINMVAGFEKEKETVRQFQAGVFVNVFSSVALYGSGLLQESLKLKPQDLMWVVMGRELIEMVNILSEGVLFISLIYVLVSGLRYIWNHRYIQRLRDCFSHRIWGAASELNNTTVKG